MQVRNYLLVRLAKDSTVAPLSALANTARKLVGKKAASRSTVPKKGKLSIGKRLTFQFNSPQPRTQYRVHVSRPSIWASDIPGLDFSKINDTPYVDIVRYYYHTGTNTWFPVKKTSCRLESSEWEQLLVQSEAISKALSAFEKAHPAKPTSQR